MTNNTGNRTAWTQGLLAGVAAIAMAAAFTAASPEEARAETDCAAGNLMS